jgi:phosphonate transport system permease protein
MQSNSVVAARADYRADQRSSRLIKLIGVLGLFSFGYWSVIHLRLPIERITQMFGRIGTWVSTRLFPPDMAYATSDQVMFSIVETIEMSILGAFVGTVISVPIAWFAAANVTPNRRLLYPFGRAVLVFTRAVPVIIWGMLLVEILGFGPIAGTVALTLLTISFAGKLMSEQIEAIDMGPVEAIRATGASRLCTFVYAVLPQVKPAWAGIIIYNWDSVFRASAVLGFVGAGGLGMFIRMQIDVLDHQKAFGIIVAIIVLVIGSEVASHFLRRRFQ